MTVYPGMWLRKIGSGRDCQVAGVNATHVWLTWGDTGQQTVVRRERLNRTKEWRTRG